MARIIVMADRVGRDAPSVLLDETVQPIHLSTGHAANQLIERLGWAISDAEDAERAYGRRRGSAPQRSAAARRGSARRQLSAARRELSATRREPSTTGRQLSATR